MTGKLPTAALCLATVMLLAPAANAAIFRSVDANGTVTFSDQPPARNSGAAAEQIELNMPNTFIDNTPRARYEPEAASTAEPEDYAELAITSPAKDEMIRENSGNVTIRTRLAPELQPGHKLRLELDGSLDAASVDGGSIYLTGLPRGTHRARLVIENEKGRRVKESEETVFHLQRFSVLLNPRPGRNNALPRPRSP